MFEYRPQQKPKKEPKMVQLKCANCECTFERYKGHVKGGVGAFERRFCSPKCKVEFMKKNGKLYSRPSKFLKPDHIRKNGRSYKVVTCNDCGKSFERRADQVNQRGTGDYCKECSMKKSSKRIKKIGYKPPKTGEMITCKNCTKEFYTNRYTVGRRKFCSEKCKHEWQRDNASIANFIKNTASGEKHGKYKHGKRVGKHGESKPRLRKAIIERDGGHWCLFCGLPGPGLHMHRVIYGSQCGKYELSNCVLLCGEHHGLVHSSKRTWQPLLLKYLSIAGTKEGREWLKQFQQSLRKDAG